MAKKIIIGERFSLTQILYLLRPINYLEGKQLMRILQKANVLIFDTLEIVLINYEKSLKTVHFKSLS